MPLTRRDGAALGEVVSHGFCRTMVRGLVTGEEVKTPVVVEFPAPPTIQTVSFLLKAVSRTIDDPVYVEVPLKAT